MIYETCGDFAHSGTQEPYLLEHNYVNDAAQPGESQAAYNSRTKSQLPRVHWRLDKPSVIQKSLMRGQVTVANVGAGQMALASIGTKTPITTPSRSQNFLGKMYQQLLFNRTLIHQLCNNMPPPAGEVYKCVGVDELEFHYGLPQQSSTGSGY